MSHSNRHHGMTLKVQRALGYGKEPLYGPEKAKCPGCGADLVFDIKRETAQMVERCLKCGHSKLYRGPPTL